MNNIAYNLFFTTEPNIVAGLFFIWVIFTFMIYGVLRSFDKVYKRDHKNFGFYKLIKTKYLFSFYNRKSGEITRHILILNIVAHVWVLLALVFNIVYAVNQTQTIIRISGTLTLGLIIFLFLIGIIGQYYKQRFEPKEKIEDNN